MKLLTPGPLTTTQRVREAMLEDRCTWDDAYKQLTQDIRQELIDLARVREDEYTTILMQGSGSYVVESVLASTLKPTDTILIITNGAYGKRMVEMVNRMGVNYIELAFNFDETPRLEVIASTLLENKQITHVAVVHCETTTGMLNPVELIGEIVQSTRKTYIVDAMSSFGGVPIDIERGAIDFLISSANKCIHGVPGFGFIIANREALSECRGVSRSLSLDIYNQWEVMDIDGKWRYTSPTHVVGAFYEAICELKEFGGIQARYIHYKMLNTYIRRKMDRLGFQSYIDDAVQSPIITTFHYPNESFDFNHFYKTLKHKGFIVYPGKLTEIDTFRIGNIGDIDLADVKRLLKVIESYMAKTGIQ